MIAALNYPICPSSGPVRGFLDLSGELREPGVRHRGLDGYPPVGHFPEQILDQVDRLLRTMGIAFGVIS